MWADPLYVPVVAVVLAICCEQHFQLLWPAQSLLVKHFQLLWPAQSLLVKLADAEVGVVDATV